MYANKYFPHYAISGLWVAFNRCGNKQHFNSEQEAMDFSEEGIVEEYKGFTITAACKIFKDHKAVFTAPWQDCRSIEDAKKMIDKALATKIELTPYEKWQADRFENIESENGAEESERFAAWNQEQAERQLFEQQY